ncbi:MAG: Cna B-type domain-containing protein, partial [Clostridia bacterium]|nr:Cna B-type domain-containing protein [Clostridia bacterium]
EHSEADHTVTWTLDNVAAGAAGTVTVKVKVLESALVSKEGPGKVVNGGETATVKVGNDHEFTLEVVENPVEEDDGSLVITKTVVSNTTADKAKEFKFNIQLDKNLTGAYGDLEFTNGVATITLKDGESKAATGLPEGTVYIVQEENADGFISSGSVRGTITEKIQYARFTNTRREGNLTVKKTVVNGTDAVKDKSFHFTVRLSDTTITGTYGDVKFTKGVAGFVLKDGESVTATGLPALISYTVTEDKYDYFRTESSNAQSVIDYGGTKVAEFRNTYTAPTPTPTPTPTNTPRPGGGGGNPTPRPTPVPKTDIVGKKIWLDENDRYNTRPQSITVQLYADGALVDATPAWTDTNTNAWTYTFSNLPAVTDAGIAIHYTVKEQPVTYYETIINGTTITNRLIPRDAERYEELAGIKTWNDNDNITGQRPTNITVRLLRNGETVESRTVTAVNGWSYSFGRLPMDDGYGNVYTYTLQEDAVPGYVSRIDGLNVTNVLVVPEKPEDDGTTERYSFDEDLLAKARGTSTPAPGFAGLGQTEMDELMDLLDYGTPLWGALMGTGDETPAYPFVFGGIGVLALAILLITRKKRGFA